MVGGAYVLSFAFVLEVVRRLALPGPGWQGLQYQRDREHHEAHQGSHDPHWTSHKWNWHWFRARATSCHRQCEVPFEQALALGRYEDFPLPVSQLQP